MGERVGHGRRGGPVEAPRSVAVIFSAARLARLGKGTVAVIGAPSGRMLLGEFDAGDDGPELSIEELLSPECVALDGAVMVIDDGSIGVTEVIRDLRARHDSLPLMCIGIELQPDKGVEFLRSGADGFLMAPLDPHDVVAACFFAGMAGVPAPPDLRARVIPVGPGAPTRWSHEPMPKAAVPEWRESEWRVPEWSVASWGVACDRAALRARSEISVGSSEPTPTPELELSPIRVLIAEDDLICSRSLRAMFGSADCNVATTTTAFDGLRLLESGRWDVVLCDLNLADGRSDELIGAAIAGGGALVVCMSSGPGLSRHPVPKLVKPVALPDVRRLVMAATQMIEASRAELSRPTVGGTVGAELSGSAGDIEVRR
jgi:DNA-binding response OmpR family regulator